MPIVITLHQNFEFPGLTLQIDFDSIENIFFKIIFLLQISKLLLRVNCHANANIDRIMSNVGCQVYVCQTN